MNIINKKDIVFLFEHHSYIVFMRLGFFIHVKLDSKITYLIAFSAGVIASSNNGRLNNESAYFIIGFALTGSFMP